MKFVKNAMIMQVVVSKSAKFVFIKNRIEKKTTSTLLEFKTVKVTF